MSATINADSMIALLSLAAMEIVLGIDNIIFIAILVGKLPVSLQKKARQIGILLALVLRILLLLSISWIMGLTEPFLEVFGKSISGRDLILLAGGLFLIGKATYEIHEKLEAGLALVEQNSRKKNVRSARFGSIIFQIIILDLVFSLDSVITAVGMAQQLWIMVIAMLFAVGVMLLLAGQISDFVHRHPTIKILALSFLILIGIMLVAEGMGEHIGKGYIYFAMAFSFAIELLNMRYRKIHQPVKLHEPGNVV